MYGDVMAQHVRIHGVASASTLLKNVVSNFLQ